MDWDNLGVSPAGRSRAAATGVMESAFEETKPYVLTELGKQFVHYVMDDVVQQLERKRRFPTYHPIRSGLGSRGRI